MTITITILPQSRNLQSDLPLFVAVAERILGAVDVQFDEAPRNAAEAEFDGYLAEVRSRPLGVRLTKAQSDEIENERIGAELCEQPFSW